MDSGKAIHEESSRKLTETHPKDPNALKTILSQEDDKEPLDKTRNTLSPERSSIKDDQKEISSGCQETVTWKKMDYKKYLDEAFGPSSEEDEDDEDSGSPQSYFETSPKRSKLATAPKSLTPRYLRNRGAQKPLRMALEEVYCTTKPIFPDENREKFKNLIDEICEHYDEKELHRCRTKLQVEAYVITKYRTFTSEHLSELEGLASYDPSLIIPPFYRKIAYVEKYLFKALYSAAGFTVDKDDGGRNFFFDMNSDVRFKFPGIAKRDNQGNIINFQKKREKCEVLSSLF